MRPQTLASITLVSLLVLDGCGEIDGLNVDGYWTGTLTPPGSTQSQPVRGLIEQGGPAFLFDDAGILYRMPTFDGSSSFQGGIKLIAPIGYGFKRGAVDTRYQINGVAEEYQISANLSSADGPGDLKLQALTPTIPDSGVEQGKWPGYYVTPTPFFVDLQMAPEGAFDGDDAFGCHLAGHIRQHQVQENLFDVTIASTGPAPFCGKTYRGLGYKADYDAFNLFRHASGTYYYIGVDDGGSGFVAEFLAP